MKSFLAKSVLLLSISFFQISTSKMPICSEALINDTPYEATTPEGIKLPPYSKYTVAKKVKFSGTTFKDQSGKVIWTVTNLGGRNIIRSSAKDHNKFMITSYNACSDKFKKIWNNKKYSKYQDVSPTS